MRIITFLKLKLQRMLFNNNFSSIVILNLRFHYCDLRDVHQTYRITSFFKFIKKDFILIIGLIILIQLYIIIV